MKYPYGLSFYLFQCGEKVQQKCYQEITYSMKHEEAERLDTMMDLVLAHIYHTCYPSGQGKIWVDCACSINHFIYNSFSLHNQTAVIVHKSEFIK